MKKRLLSMLMAVLMIASLVPAVALADSTTAAHAGHDVLTVSTPVDAAAKQAGIEFAYCNDDNVILKELKVTPFAEKADVNKCAALGHNWKSVELQAATCTHKGIAITICSNCGTLKTDSYKTTDATGHVYAATGFGVVVKPVCEKDGWGYAVCANCKHPVFVANSTTAYNLFTSTNKKYTNAQAEAVKAMFKATGHADTDKYVTVDKDVYKPDGTIRYHAAVKPTHVETVGWTTGATVWDAQLKVWKAEINAAGTSVKFVEALADPTLGGGKGQTGDAYCPDCGKIMVPNEPVIKTNDWSLSAAHKNYMSIKSEADKGFYPYIDAAGKHDGRTDRVWCEKCGEYFGGTVLPFDEYYNPNSNDLTVGQTFTVPAVAATCTQDGNTAKTLTYTNLGWAVTNKGEVIPATGHHWAKLPDVTATCTESGYIYDNVYACDNTFVGTDGKTYVCGTYTANGYTPTYKPGTQSAQITEVPAACSYATKVVVEPTCSSAGLSVKYCTVCGAYATNPFGTPAVYAVPATGHVAGDPVNAKEATCTEVGYTGDKVCKWCGIMLEKGKEIPMKEHTSVDVAAVEATCTTDGMTAGTKCSVCDKVLTGCEVVKALGHDYKDGKCTRCGEKDPNYVAPEFKDAASIRDYAKDAVAWAAKEGIVKGDENGNFLPTADITRQDFVTMLWRLKGSVASEKALTFGDKADIKDYAQTAVAWAVENGYINGRDNGNFDPAAKITRAEIVAILNRVAENAKAEKAADFTDIATHWAKDAIAWAAEAGIVNGVGNNMFAPNDNASRQDTVVMLYKFVNLK